VTIAQSRELVEEAGKENEQAKQRSNETKGAGTGQGMEDN
jgi:hypothetical protein